MFGGRRMKFSGRWRRTSLVVDTPWLDCWLEGEKASVEVALAWVELLDLQSVEA